MNGFTLYYADRRDAEENCVYPHEAVVESADPLRQAVQHDYVCVTYKDSYRSNANYIASNCLGMDCDNDHSDDPQDWITPERIRETFPDVPFAVHFSRHNNISKHGKVPRPKFHVLFQIDSITDPDEYRLLKVRVNSVFPYFDTKALDAARFFFGTADPKVMFFPGTMTLNACLDKYYPDEDEDIYIGDYEPNRIPEGCRNATMSHFAGKILKRYGDCDQAYNLFLERAQQCDPPLDDRELAHIWRSAQNFYKRISASPDYIPPEEYNARNAGSLYEPTDFSDVAEARMLAEVFAGILRYSPATDYIHYNGIIWEESIPMAHGVVHALTDLQLEEATRKADAAWDVLMNNGAAQVMKTASSKRKGRAMLSEDQEKALIAFEAAQSYKSLAMHYRDSKHIGGILKEAPPMLLIEPRDLDADPFLLNTPEATYDLTKGLDGRQEHSADDFITKVTAVSPSDRGMQLWLDALGVFFVGDQELIDYVQLVAGMVAVGKVFVETLIIAYGDGRNGKSTFWNVLAHVLGTYSGNLSADALTVGCRRNIKPEMAEAKGKRLLIASELEEGMRMNTSFVKQMSSTDDVWAEKKYKAPFAYTPSHTPVLYTNHLPRVGETDPGTWRRLVVIPFNARIEGKSDIKNYGDYLFTNAGEAVLAWTIEGARRIIAMNFKITPPKCVRDAIAAYRNQNDWLQHFLDECCEVGDAYTARSGELYAKYREYCAKCNEYTRSTTDFYTALEKTGFTRQRTRTGRFVRGLRVVEIPSDDDDDFLT